MWSTSTASRAHPTRWAGSSRELLERLKVIRRHDSPEADLESVAGRVFLVTSVGARHDYRKPAAGQPTKKGRCLWASGRLGGGIVDVPERVAQELQTATEGSRQRRRLRQAEDKDEGPLAGAQSSSSSRSSGGCPAAPRARSRGGASTAASSGPGEVVWGPPRPTRQRRARVEAVRLSALRTSGVGEHLDRIHPCDPESPAGVCLTCAIFGAIDADGDRGQGKQSAYAAHIRLGEHVSTRAGRAAQGAAVADGHTEPRRRHVLSAERDETPRQPSVG